MSMVRTPWPGKNSIKTGEEENYADDILHNMPEEPQDWMMILHPRAGTTDIKIVCRQPDQNQWNGNQGADKSDRPRPVRPMSTSTGIHC